MIFFTNFLALIIQVELADEESRNTAVYSVLLILVHVLFFLSICWNSWTTMKATFNRRHVQVWPPRVHLYYVWADRQPVLQIAVLLTPVTFINSASSVVATFSCNKLSKYGCIIILAFAMRQRPASLRSLHRAKGPNPYVSVGLNEFYPSQNVH